MSHYKPYPAYKDSGVEWLGRVPEHWGVKPLKLLVKEGSTISYGIVQPGEPLDEGVPFVQTTNMSSGHFEIESLQKTTSEIAAGFPRSRLTGGEVILGIRASIGAAFVVPMHLAGVNLSRGVARIDCSSELSSRFLMAYLSSIAVDGYWQLAKQGSTFNEVSIATVKELLVPVPPSGEQADIEGVLSNATARLDALIEKKTRFINLLREKRHALITHAVTKGLDPNVKMKDSGVEWLGEVPEHWEMVPLKYVTPSLTVGIVVNPSDYVADEGLPFLYGGDIGEGVIFAETARRISPEHSQRNAKTRLNAGDLVTVRVGAPGVTAVVPPECEGGNCASVMLIRHGAFNSDWLCYTMNSRVVRYQVEVVQYGAAQQQFNISHAVDFLIPVPPLEEQAQIASVLNLERMRVDALLSKTERSIDLLKERRSALITAAVTGQIDLREAV